MKKSISMLLCFVLILSCFAGCSAAKPQSLTVPEDFSFYMVWGCYGISSYNSKTGKLVKTNDCEDESKYTAYVTLTQEQLATVYHYLFGDIDIFDFPESYDPFNAPNAKNKVVSTPSQTIYFSVTANGQTKTVSCDGVAIGDIKDGYNKQARAFLTAQSQIVSLLTALPEWQAFPDYENLYS